MMLPQGNMKTFCFQVVVVTFLLHLFVNCLYTALISQAISLEKQALHLIDQVEWLRGQLCLSFCRYPKHEVQPSPPDYTWLSL